MKRVKKAIIGIFSLCTFVALMMIHVTVDKQDDLLVHNSECYSVTEWNLHTGLMNATARGSDPEECDDSEGDCPRTCTGGCSGCFGWGGSCKNQDLPHYCGTLQGSDGSFTTCYRQCFDGC